MSSQATDHRSGLIETVRRKLAAMFGSVSSRSVSIPAAAPTARQREFALTPDAMRPRLGDMRGTLSRGQLGGHALPNAAAIAVTISRDTLAQLDPVKIHDGTLEALTGRSVALVMDEIEAPEIGRIELVDTARECASVSSPFRIAKAAVHARDVARPPKFTKADRRAISLKIAGAAPRIVPPRIVSEITIERRREPMIPRSLGGGQAGFEREIDLLRAACGEPDADIKLVGVYCRVPIGSISRMEFDPPTGSLMLSVREDAAQTIGVSKRPVVTLILGQIVATGRMVRALRT